MHNGQGEPEAQLLNPGNLLHNLQQTMEVAAQSKTSSLQSS